MTQTKFKRVPFDIELAKKITQNEAKGRIMTEDNLPARIVCFDLKHGGSKILAVLVDCGDYEIGIRCDLDGICRDTREEDKFNLHLEVPTYYRDYSNFMPQKWQPCLVRASISDHWKVRVCADNKQQVTFYDSGNSCSGDIMWDFKLPISKVTERLMGTTKSYEELIKELDENDQD